MQAVQRRLLNELENMETEGLFDDVSFGCLPQQDRLSLTEQNGCLRVTVPSDCWHGTDHTADDPGEVDVVYWRDWGIMLVDVGGELHAEE